MCSAKSTTHNRKNLILSHLGAILTVSIWGASFVSTKVLLENRLSPSEIYILRFLMAYLLILIVCHKNFGRTHCATNCCSPLAVFAQVRFTSLPKTQLSNIPSPQM